MTIAEVWLPPPPPSALEIVQMASVAKGHLGLERSYMAGSKAVVDANAMAEKAATRFSLLFPKWKIRHEAVWGSPTWELYSRAEEWKADLLIVGSHGRSALGRLFLGSISQWLLNEARCSVRVARGKLDEPDFPVRLLVGIDGSRNADAALEQVAARHWPAKSEARVVLVEQRLELTYVGSLAAPLRRSVAAINNQEHQAALRLVKTAAKKLRDAGLRSRADVIEGDPKRTLVQLAEEWRADCIFLGATGMSNRLERFLLGSTAGAVAARSHCSVEIVRVRKRKRKTNGNGN